MRSKAQNKIWKGCQRKGRLHLVWDSRRECKLLIYSNMRGFNFLLKLLEFLVLPTSTLVFLWLWCIVSLATVKEKGLMTHLKALLKGSVRGRDLLLCTNAGGFGGWIFLPSLLPGLSVSLEEEGHCTDVKKRVLNWFWCGQLGQSQKFKILVQDV